MTASIEIKSIRFRSGDWKHCFCCRAEKKKVKATHEMRIKGETCWIPFCSNCLEVAKKHSCENLEWREKVD